MCRTFFVLSKCTIQGEPKVDVLLIAFLYLWLKVWDGIDKYCIVPIRKLFYFRHCPKPVFFNCQTWVFKKNCNCCCILIFVILITLKLQIGACNGQINTYELSTIIMRHEVQVLFYDYRTFVVGQPVSVY